MKKFVVCLFLALFCTACNNVSDSEIVVQHHWKYTHGSHRLGDWVVFSKEKNTGLFLSNDTIYRDGEPVALLTSLVHLVDHYKMEVTSLRSGRSGYYTEK